MSLRTDLPPQHAATSSRQTHTREPSLDPLQGFQTNKTRRSDVQNLPVPETMHQNIFPDQQHPFIPAPASLLPARAPSQLTVVQPHIMFIPFQSMLGAKARFRLLWRHAPCRRAFHSIKTARRQWPDMHSDWHQRRKSRTLQLRSHGQK